MVFCVNSNVYSTVEPHTHVGEKRKPILEFLMVITANSIMHL